MEGHARTNRDVLYVGRTDFRLTIHNPPPIKASVSLAGTETERLTGHQEIVYSTYTPNTYDRPLAEFWAKSGTGSEQVKTRVELGHDGVAVGVEDGGGVSWMTSLGSIGIAVYDILQPLTQSNPILLPQPPPHLPSLFPLPANPHPAHLDVLSKPPSTYIGQVSPLALGPVIIQDNGSSEGHKHPQIRSTKPLLYALSSSSYPLINFAPPPRPGSLTNGSFLLSDDLPERDQLLPYLLDPPNDDKGLIESSEVSETWGLKEKEQPSGFGWFIFSGLCGVVLCVLAVFGYGRRKATIPNQESAPLLESVPREKMVTIVESPIESRPTDTSAPNDETTPKKRSTRRRVRGKKKRRDSSAALLDVDEDEEDEEKDGSMSGSPRGSADKPLPDLPREMLSKHDKERLAISDTVIGGLKT